MAKDSASQATALALKLGELSPAIRNGKVGLTYLTPRLPLAALVLALALALALISEPLTLNPKPETLNPKP